MTIELKPETKLAAIVLAAGAARRFGKPKQLERWPTNGSTLVEYALSNALACNPTQLILVTGNAADQVSTVAEGWAGLKLPPTPPPYQTIYSNVYNPRWADGQGFSVVTGVNALSAEIEAALFFLADQPRLSPITGLTLANIFRQTPNHRAIIFPTWQGKRGNPVLFGRAHFPALALLQGDEGGRVVVKANLDCVQEVAVSDPSILEDVDTPQDLSNLSA